MPSKPRLTPSEPPTPPEPRRPPDLARLAEQVRQIARENEALFRQLRDGERRFRTLARGVWRVQEQERARLARELHDGIGQTLTALKIRLEQLARAAAGSRSLADGLAESVTLVGQALEETRQLSHLLRPRILDDLGLVPALTWFARALRRLSGLETEVSVQGLAQERLDPDLETLLFRVVQEALNNVVKHSGAASARVELERQGGWLRLRVADSGCGFDPAGAMAGHGAAAGYGLRGIRERVELFEGRLVVRSAPGAGTVVGVEVPAGAGEEG